MCTTRSWVQIFSSHNVSVMILSMHDVSVIMTLTVCRPELEEHTQHVMSLAYQYAFGGANHFDPEKVMKVPHVLHIKRCRKLEIYLTDFI